MRMSFSFDRSYKTTANDLPQLDSFCYFFLFHYPINLIESYTMVRFQCSPEKLCITWQFSLPLTTVLRFTAMGYTTNTTLSHITATLQCVLNSCY